MFNNIKVKFVKSVTASRSTKTFDIEVDSDLHAFKVKHPDTGAVGISHNSAMISLSNLSDDRMRHAKSGAWWETQGQRALANNSACYTEKPDVGVFMREWLALYDSKSGERGIFNREAAQKIVKKNGRRDPEHEFGTNPCCFTGDTQIAVADGRNAVSIAELAAESQGQFSFPVYSAARLKTHAWGGDICKFVSWKTEVKNAIAKSTGHKPVFLVTLSNGDTFEATDDHPLATQDGIYVQVKDSLGVPLEVFFSVKSKCRRTNSPIDEFEVEPSPHEHLTSSVHVVAIEARGVKEIFDLQVEDNHNFFIITKAFDENAETCRGILVHNSEIILRPYQFCVAGDTKLITRNGLVKIEDAVDTKIEIWNGEKWASVTPFQTGTHDRLHRVHFSDGSYLDATDNHKFLVKNRFQTEFYEIETLELIERLKTDQHSLHVPPPNIQYSDGVFKPDAYDLGFILGDGCIPKGTDTAGAGLFGKDKLLNFSTATISEKTYLNYNGTPYKSVKFDVDAEFCRKMKYEAGLPTEIFGWDRKSILNFIAGWADADGTQASKGIRIAGDGTKLRDAQLLLTKIGLKCSLNFGAAAGSITNLGTRKNDIWYIQITKTDEIPCQRLKCDNADLPKWRGKNQIIKRIETLSGFSPSYCLNEPELHQCVFNNVLTKQCNLSEVIVRAEDNVETLKRKVRIATILGTFQATMTHFPYLRKIWRDNTEAERLLGVSMTGVLDNHLFTDPDDPEMATLLEELKTYAVEINAEFADPLGIKRSAAITAIKPSGCTTLNTKVKTDRGIMTMEEIFVANGVDDASTLAAGTWIEPLTNITVRDENDDEKAITKLFINGHAPVFELVVEDGSTYRFTGEHKLKTTSGWKRIDELAEGDDIVCFSTIHASPQN